MTPHNKPKTNNVCCSYLSGKKVFFLDEISGVTFSALHVSQILAKVMTCVSMKMEKIYLLP